MIARVRKSRNDVRVEEARSDVIQKGPGCFWMTVGGSE